MLANAKAFVVILFLASIGFAMVRPFCLQYMTPETYRRRRNAWMLLTSVAFLSPSFVIYAAVGAVLVARQVSREENIPALFVLLVCAVPNVSYYLPTLLINNLFDLTQVRLITFVLLVPWCFKQLQRGDFKALTFVDLCVLSYLVLQVALSFSNQSATSSMRQAFLLIVDTFIVFYAFSRVRGAAIGEVMAMFVVSSFVMALVGFFEWGKGWLLYDGLSQLWGSPLAFGWIGRNDHVRAMATYGGPLGLGLQLALALILFMYTRSSVTKVSLQWAVMGVFALGLYASGSRGPWLMTLLGVLIFLFSRPGALKRAPAVIVGGCVCFLVMYFSPLRETVIDRLPIIGTSDQDTIGYRQQLAELSWSLIKLHPFLGDPFVTLRMESLRQGQGIIDIVNGFIFTLLFTGWVGLILQNSVFIIALVLGTKACRRARLDDPDMSALGVALIASVIASLFFVATAGYAQPMYFMTGLLVAYVGAVASAPLATRLQGAGSGRSRAVPV